MSRSRQPKHRHYGRTRCGLCSGLRATRRRALAGKSMADILREGRAEMPTATIYRIAHPAKVIDITDRLPRPDGLVWWVGPVRCTACDRAHVTVIPIPPWAAGPPTSECSACHEMACLETKV